ncbi:MAG: peptide-methionine (R)-S-oxide reductase MsrB [Ignavibacteria bacterium]
MEDDRRRLLFAAATLFGATLVPLATAAAAALRKSDREWKALLPANRYRVLFQEDTEPPFSSPLNGEKRAGIFICAACFQPLFDATRKFDSGTGWPSFWEVLPGAVGTKSDLALGMSRIEYHCARCGGHQGHVFDDGPAPTHLRYCNNGLALQFVAAGQPLPALRT